jgi:hypothetical protein
MSAGMLEGSLILDTNWQFRTQEPSWSRQGHPVGLIRITLQPQTLGKAPEHVTAKDTCTVVHELMLLVLQPSRQTSRYGAAQPPEGGSIPRTALDAGTTATESATAMNNNQPASGLLYERTTQVQPDR